MKIYDVNVHYDAIITIRVTADTEAEAKKKAFDIAFSEPQSNFEFEHSDTCVTHEQEVEVADKDGIRVLGFPKYPYGNQEDELRAMSDDQLYALACDDIRCHVYDSTAEYLASVTAGCVRNADNYLWLTSKNPHYVQG